MMKNDKEGHFLPFLFLILAGIFPNQSLGHPVLKTKEDSKIPCGLIEDVVGQVQVLGADRTHFVDVKPKVQVACGTWLAVLEGWIKVRHVSGPSIQLGPGSFAQLVDFKKDTVFKGDHVVLYRGQSLAEVSNGSEELRIVSPSGRARVKHGKILFYSREGDDEAQLIVLKDSATLENRFSPQTKVKVHSGEATTLNLKLRRVIPTYPRAVALAQLKPRLYVFRLDERDRSEVISLAFERQSRKLASELVTRKAKTEPEFTSKPTSPSPDVVNRKIAGVASGEPSKTVSINESDADLTKHWINKMVSGEKSGEKILFPNKALDSAQGVKAGGEDPEFKSKKKLRKDEEEEKKRLIEELSKIRVE